MVTLKTIAAAPFGIERAQLRLQMIEEQDEQIALLELQSKRIAKLRACFNLRAMVLKYEGDLIANALRLTNGRISKAAELLGMSYQGLGYTISTRHEELLSQRSPVQRRQKRAKN